MYTLNIYWSVKFTRKKNNTETTIHNSIGNDRSEERNFAFAKIERKNIVRKREIVAGKKIVFTHAYKKHKWQNHMPAEKKSLANSNDIQPQRDRLNPATKTTKIHTNLHISEMKSKKTKEREKKNSIYWILNVWPVFYAAFVLFGYSYTYIRTALLCGSESFGIYVSQMRIKKNVATKFCYCEQFKKMSRMYYDVYSSRIESKMQMGVRLCECLFVCRICTFDISKCILLCVCKCRQCK